MKKLIILITALAFWGCEKDSTGVGNGNSNYSDLIGTWIGYEVGNSDEGDWTFIISSNEIDITVANQEEWYKGTYSTNMQTNPKQLDLLITDCSFPDYIGLTSLGIYKIEGNTLTFAGNEPGNPIRELSFSGDGNRVFVLTKQ